MSMKKECISIVVPVYNEDSVIEFFVKELIQVLEKINYSFKIILVDDGSSDKSLEKIKDLCKTYDNLRYISFTRNFGHQAALLAGIEKASGAAIIMMDADLQHPPLIIKDLLREWESGSKVVQTIRKDVNFSVFKKVTSRLFYFFINLISEIKLNPSSPDFRLIDRDVARELLRFKEKDLFLRGIIPWLGFKTSYIGFESNKRFAGKSKYSVIKMIEFAVSGITSFSTMPLRAAIYVGIIISLFSFCFGIHSLFVRVFTNRAVPGWTSLMVGVFFIGGLLMIFLGVLGEYIGKTFLQSKNRPNYIIKEESEFDHKK